MAGTSEPTKAPNIIQQLETVLQHLSKNPYPVLASPPETKKRASVAVIIRIQPSYAHWPPQISQPNLSTGDSNHLQQFFSLPWVKHGEPEVLFIRRAARKGDRWNGHVALPGGNRDPEDADDNATAIREAFEEVGVDLSPSHVLPVGNLPQRLVTSGWGSKPIMVLCPYIYLLTDPRLPPLRLQPTEAASAHWVPISWLLSPQARVFEYQDVGNRTENKGNVLRRWLGRLLLSHMMFAAIRLVPTESMYSISGAPSLSDPQPATISTLGRLSTTIRSWVGGKPELVIASDRPLKMWGLTLGVIADLLEFLPPHNALELWTYPTFSPPDLHFIIWAFTYNFRKRKALILGSHEAVAGPQTIEIGYDTIPTPSWLRAREKRIDRFPSPIPAGLGSISQRIGTKHSSNAIGAMLEGYYEIMRKAILLTMLARGITLTAVILAIWRSRRRRTAA